MIVTGFEVVRGRGCWAAGVLGDWVLGDWVLGDWVLGDWDGICRFSRLRTLRTDLSLHLR